MLSFRLKNLTIIHIAPHGAVTIAQNRRKLVVPQLHCIRRNCCRKPTGNAGVFQRNQYGKVDPPNSWISGKNCVLA